MRLIRGWREARPAAKPHGGAPRPAAWDPYARAGIPSGRRRVAPERPARVLIVSASAGAGHEGASRELEQRLRARGFQVDCRDLADIFPYGLGKLLRGTYHGMLSRFPWIYGSLFAIGCGFAGAGPITRALLRPVRPQVRKLVGPETRAVVSTYPIATQLLGPLRRRGQLDVPVITYLTDFAVNPLWVSPGVDVYCAAHPSTRAQAGALGASEVRVVGRLVSAGFGPGTEQARRDARERFGLPAQGRLALLVAGSWGVGEVAKTAAEIARTGVAVPVVVCGHNEALYRRLRRQRTAYVFGWVDDMPALLRAADVLVENAGGLTALEAMASGLPVATYRPIPGHGRANAVTMAEAGMVTWVRHPDELGPALLALTEGVRGRRQREAGLALFRADPAEVIADLARGTGVRPNPAPKPSALTQGRRGRRARRAGVLVCLAVAALNWYAHHHAQQPTPPGRRR
ncbi:glycosyltransferase [Micromonospora sp. NPDC050397]|uniref:MGDG synthase family glycosyltransferase n=1 Tax=Micromonospora sp. NPDC050397 TaxID=3364279 RepID=UPI00384E036D